MSWPTNLRDYGLSLIYIKAFVDACECQNVYYVNPIDMVIKWITLTNESATPIEEYVIKYVQKLDETQ